MVMWYVGQVDHFRWLKFVVLLFVLAGCSVDSNGSAPDTGGPSQPTPIVETWRFEIDLGRQVQTDSGWTATLDTNPTAELQISATGWRAEVHND